MHVAFSNGYSYAQIYISIYPRVYTYLLLSTYTRVCILKKKNIYIYMRVCNVHTHTYIYIHIYLYKLLYEYKSWVYTFCRYIHIYISILYVFYVDLRYLTRIRFVADRITCIILIYVLVGNYFSIIITNMQRNEFPFYGTCIELFNSHWYAQCVHYGKYLAMPDFLQTLHVPESIDRSGYFCNRTLSLCLSHSFYREHARGASTFF